MVSDFSVSALTNSSALVKRIPPHLLSVQQSLPRVLQLRLGSRSKAAAVSRSKILPPQRPGSLFLFEEDQFPPGQVERKYISRSRSRQKKKPSNFPVVWMEMVEKCPTPFCSTVSGHHLGKGEPKKKKIIYSLVGPWKFILHLHVAFHKRSKHEQRTNAAFSATG